MKIFYLMCSLMFLLIISCNNKQSQTASDAAQLFQLLKPEETGINFVNEVVDGDDFNILTYRNFYNGGGVAIGDINNDSLPDIFFTANQKKNRLYLNKGNLHFEDITEKAGVGGTMTWSTGVTMADVNGDGLLDIYVCNSGDVAGNNKKNELYINNGNLTFSEKGREYNLDNEGYTTHAAFFDYDMDGDLDCYILNNSFRDPGKIELYKKVRELPSAGGHRLMRNDGNTFTDVTQEAGIYSSDIAFGLGVAVADLNGDHLPDLYISNDFWERDYLYINKGNGKFSEELTSRINYCSTSSMGADIADINNDGSPEIFTTDMLPQVSRFIGEHQITKPSKSIVLQWLCFDHRKKFPVIISALFINRVCIFLVSIKLKEIHRHDIFQNTVANKDVLHAIVFKIKNQSAPTPVSCVYP